MPKRHEYAACVILSGMACFGACSPPAPERPEHGPLYDRIREYRADYEAGIETILAGDAITGKNLLVAASTRLSVAAQECSRTPGCDAGLFLDALNDVVEQGAGGSTVASDVAGSESSAIVDAVPELARTAALLRGTDLRELIPMNRQVKAALDRWLTSGRPDLLAAWENYQFLRAEMAPAYESADLPEALLFAMLAQETGGKVHSYSRAGAVGPLQFMPRTARRYGLRIVDGFDLRLDPAASARANAAYLDEQFRVLNRDLEKALAAYNGGESRVRRLHRKHADADFWDPRIYYSLPDETRDYVPGILAAAILFLHPEEYGLELRSIEAAMSTVKLAEAISISELVVCLGQRGNADGWYRTLRNLNPRLDPGERVPSRGTIEMPASVVADYAERCVGDSRWLALARDLHDADYPERPDVRDYTVRRGDTLAEIAARHRIPVRELASANRLDAPEYLIHVGQRLTLPGS
jgi:membrane-bound lytic murein transglycosylase D